MSACLFSCSAVSSSLWSHGLWPTRLLCPWNFPGKNTRVGCPLRTWMGREVGGGSGWGTHVHLWLIHFNVWQKSLQYCKAISLQLNKIFKRKKKKILERIVISYSRGSSPPGGQTHIFCIDHSGKWVLYHCTIWEVTVCVVCSFPVWLTSLSIMPSSCIHVVTNGRIFFFLKAEWYSIVVCRFITTLSIHLLTGTLFSYLVYCRIILQ